MSSIYEFPLPSNQIHVWRLDLEKSTDQVSCLFACLGADEVSRAGRFKFDKDRRRYIACRGALRRILGGYLGEDAREVAFEYGPAGKPSVSGGGDIRFNLSHSHEACVVAVAKGREVGVDVEKVRTMPNSEEIARRFFPSADWNSLMELPPYLRQDAFFRLWVRIEAAIKAGGHGFSAPVAGSWVVRELEESTSASGGRYFAAVAAEGSDWIVQERNRGDLFLE